MRSVPLMMLAILAAPASAEVTNATSNGFEVRQTVNLVVPKAQAFAAIGELPKWWSAEHSFSNNAANLSLSLQPGGCLCERFPDGGGAEFMHVVYMKPGERVVLRGSLGPMLFEANSGIMDFTVEPIAGGSRVVLTYSAAGFDKGNAAAMAPAVDAVLGEQMKRFRAYVAAGGGK